MKCKKGYKKSGDKCVKTKSRSKKNKINLDALWIFVTIFGILIIAGLVFYGGKAGWFKSLTVIEDTDLISFLNEPEVISTTCSLSISPNSIWVGDRTTGTIVDGKNKLCHVYVLQGGDWLSAYQGYTDINGVLTNTRTMNLPGDYIFRAICDLNNNNRVDTSDCLTNQAELTVIPRPDAPDDAPDDAPEPEDGWEVGDIIGSGGGSGLTTGDSVYEIISLTPGDNPCTLGIRINAEWNHWSDGLYPMIDGECFNPNVQDWQSLYWSFQDSTALRWSDVMEAPPVKTLSADICPAYYTVDGTPWQIQMQPAFDDADFPPPGCQVGYSYDYEIYNCECP